MATASKKRLLLEREYKSVDRFRGKPLNELNEEEVKEYREERLRLFDAC